MTTIPQIKAKAEEDIWETILPHLKQGTDQYIIANKVDVSASWLSRYLWKNEDRVKADTDIYSWKYCRTKNRW